VTAGSRKPPGSGQIVPAWVVIPVAGAAGFFTAQWLGLVFGLVVGVFLWRLRR
jgi:hypothetical protein